MPTFIDESGDPGVVQGSSRFFRLAAVWFEHEMSINQYLDAVERLRSQVLRLPATFEFHFAQNNNRQYVAILNAGFRSLRSGRGPLKKLIRSIKPGKSRVDPRLQLVDMVCGAVGSYLDGDDTFYKLFSTKKIGIELLSGK